VPATRRIADALTAALARLLVGVFFRSLEVTGDAYVPPVGPVVEVANHQNGLVDALVLIAASRRYPRFLAKSTLWRIVPLRPFLALAGALPVYRDTDVAGVLTGEQRAQGNTAALAHASRLLAEGGAVGVFPEGISHDLASLQELRSGAARLALNAAADGSAGVSIVPVGLFYDDKARFRSRVLVRFGPPRSVDGLLGVYRADRRAAARQLTAAIAADLRAIGPDYDSVAVAERCSRLAAIAVDPVASPGDVVPHGLLAERERIARRLAHAAADPDPATASAWAGLDAAHAAYRAGLARLGIDDAQLLATAGGNRPPRAAYRIGDPAGAGARLLVSAVGVAVHAGPYAILRLVGRLPRNQGMRSTVKLLGSFGLYNVTYLLLGALTARRRGWRAGFLAAVAAPASGWVALRTLERAEELGGLRRAALVVGRGRRPAELLLAERADVVAAARALAGVTG
jgi:glycerol-3-phosphate O-acyltransferase/dihydroxyacetone phosphate acyltransferase